MKNVLITGSSSGFGKQLVYDLIDAGYFVIASMRNAEAREHFFNDCLKKENLKVIELDVTSSKNRTSVRNYIQNELDGRLDILINNAGYGTYGALEDISEDKIRQQMEVNFFGPTLMIKDFLPMLRDSKGKIINITSLMGRFSMPLASVYSASKYAMEGITEGLYYELQSHGVQISSVQPGAHRTSFVKSIVWGENSKNLESPYLTQTQGLEGLMKKLTSREKAPQSSAVSSVVLKLINSPKIPRRVLVGKDALATAWMQKITPEWFYHFILSFGFRKKLKI